MCVCVGEILVILSQRINKVAEGSARGWMAQGEAVYQSMGTSPFESLWRKSDIFGAQHPPLYNGHGIKE